MLEEETESEETGGQTKWLDIGKEKVDEEAEEEGDDEEERG